jgi:hypothetical protein
VPNTSESRRRLNVLERWWRVIVPSSCTAIANLQALVSSSPRALETETHSIKASSCDKLSKRRKHSESEGQAYKNLVLKMKHFGELCPVYLTLRTALLAPFDYYYW